MVLDRFHDYENGEEKSLRIILSALPKITRKLAYARTLRNRLWRTAGLIRLSGGKTVGGLHQIGEMRNDHDL